MLLVLSGESYYAIKLEPGAYNNGPNAGIRRFGNDLVTFEVAAPSNPEFFEEVFVN